MIFGRYIEAAPSGQPAAGVPHAAPAVGAGHPARVQNAK
jgi:hypothetical protein